MISNFRIVKKYKDVVYGVHRTKWKDYATY